MHMRMDVCLAGMGFAENVSIFNEWPQCEIYKYF